MENMQYSSGFKSIFKKIFGFQIWELLNVKQVKKQQIAKLTVSSKHRVIYRVGKGFSRTFQHG